MALFPADLPWLRKPAAVRAAASMILASGAAASALIGFAEVGSGEPAIERPRRDRVLARSIEQRIETGEADGPPDSLDRALELLRRSASVPAGSFVFVVSDFLPPPSPAAMHTAVASGWDVVAVVVQDPVWERSFPEVGGVTLPLTDPDGGGLALVRLDRREARARREENELRARRLEQALDDLALDSVTLTSAEPESIHRAFLAWAEARVARTRGFR